MGSPHFAMKCCKLYWLKYLTELTILVPAFRSSELELYVHVVQVDPQVYFVLERLAYTTLCVRAPDCDNRKD